MTAQELSDHVGERVMCPVRRMDHAMTAAQIRHAMISTDAFVIGGFGGKIDFSEPQDPDSFDPKMRDPYAWHDVASLIDGRA